VDFQLVITELFSLG